VFVAQFWTGFSPQGYASMTTNELVINFFEVYLAAPIILISYVGYKICFRTKFVKTRDVDVDTGRRETKEGLEALKEGDRAVFMGRPWYGKVYYTFC